ncbi:MAG TPA: hypothetical protein VE074_08255, partial [Jatrophihabitantaceae bacterium]|nr:hypothetical protein [Jatrophihabitantaceae bacterium]
MRPSRIALAAAAIVSVALVTPTSASATRSIYHDPSPSAVASYIAHNANQPYMGWSSWSMQSSHYPGLNTQGDYSWLTEQHVL